MNDLYGEIDELVQEELEAVLDEKSSKSAKRKRKKKRAKKKAKKDACYHKVKSRYKVWPSAYASGALVKCRKVGAKNWGNSKKEHLRTIIEDELTQVLQETALDGPVPSMRRPGVGHSGMFNEPEPDEYKKIKAKISEIIDDMKEELSFLSGAESALEEMKTKMLNPEKFDFNLAMGTDTFGINQKAAAVYKERPKFFKLYIEFVNKILQELREKVNSEEITKNQFIEITQFASSSAKNNSRAGGTGKFNYPSIARLKWIYKRLIDTGKYDRDRKGISIDTLPDAEAISNDNYLEEKQENSLEDIVYYTLFEVLEEKKRKKKRKLTAKPSSETSLRDWFGRKGAKGKKGGWVDCNTCRKDKKTGRKKCSACGRSGGEKRSKYPSCRPTPGACGKRGKWGKKSKKGKKG